MELKIAIKKLTTSDLTFFEWHFKNYNAGNQKAINLNRNVFIDILYPSLPSAANQSGGKLPLDITLYGPGLYGGYNLQRKIIKGETYKNWRLNGEFVYNPDETPDRFNALLPDDIAVFVFYGDIQPYSVKTLLVSRETTEDKEIHKELINSLNTHKMVPLSILDLENIIGKISPHPDHPIFELILEEAIEDAALNGYRGIEKLRKRRSGRILSKIDIQKARQRTDYIGQAGEEFINAHFEILKNRGEIREIKWASMQNAISSYDFEIIDKCGVSRLLDVKATIGGFKRDIHISFAELLTMQKSNKSYDLYRVYGITDALAKLRIAYDLSDFANKILDSLQKLPKGVTIDSISISPSILPFGEEIEISLPNSSYTEDNFFD